MLAEHPELDYVVLAEPYSYGLAGKLAYLVRLVRGMYYLQTARLFVTDNAYLPIHVAPHRAADDGRPGVARGGRAQALRARPGHAAGRAGTDVPASLLRFRSSSAANGRDGRMPRPSGPRSSGSSRSARHARTSSSTPTRWPPRATGCWPVIRRWPAAASSSTHRRSAVEVSASGRRPGSTRSPSGRHCRPATRWSSRPTPTSTRRRPRPPASTWWSIRPPRSTTCCRDRHPHHRLLVVGRRVRAAPPPDRAAGRRPGRVRADPGLYLDYRTEMIGTQVVDTAGSSTRSRPDGSTCPATTPSSSASSGASRGGASERFVDHFLAMVRASPRRGDTLPPDVRHV